MAYFLNSDTSFEIDSWWGKKIGVLMNPRLKKKVPYSNNIVVVIQQTILCQEFWHPDDGFTKQQPAYRVTALANTMVDGETRRTESCCHVFRHGDEALQLIIQWPVVPSVDELQKLLAEIYYWSQTSQFWRWLEDGWSILFCWKNYHHLVGGDWNMNGLWLSRNSWEWNVIIPSDFHSIIFQRGRLKPPSRKSLWVVINPGLMIFWLMVTSQMITFSG